MMVVDPRTPCIVGVGTRTYRAADGDAPEPLAMWAEVARLAGADAGVGAGTAGVLESIDSVQVVYCQSWGYDDPALRLAESLGIEANHRLYSGIGGTVPQQLLGSASEAILNGAYDVALICGGEALATKRRIKKEGRTADWSFRHPERPAFPLEAPFLDTEIAHQVFQAYLTFPMFDIGRRAALGIAPDEYQRLIGALLAPMTAVAAANPEAWFPVERTAAELMTTSAENRMVAYPYPKYTVAVMDVDMAGALLVMSHAKADELGVPADRRVYPRGWSYLTDPYYLAEHENYDRSPAMAAASAAAFSRAGVGVDDVAHFDLYSCFASSIHFALDALGLAPDDPRGFTVTGGLPFAGGPGSNYMLGSIAAMVRTLREDAGSVGVVSGVGMHMTKHAYGVLSTTPGPVEAPIDTPLQVALDDAHPPRTVIDTHEGTAIIKTYSVEHDRAGHPSWGLAVGETEEGERFYARIEGELLAEIETTEWVGAKVEVGLDPSNPAVNVITETD